MASAAAQEMETIMERCPCCGHKREYQQPTGWKPHPEDVRMEKEAKREAKERIGPFWRSNWRAFVALVQTYADVEAHEKLETLRERFWISNSRKGPPPTPPSEISDGR